MEVTVWFRKKFHGKVGTFKVGENAGLIFTDGVVGFRDGKTTYLWNLDEVLSIDLRDTGETNEGN